MRRDQTVEIRVRIEPVGRARRDFRIARQERAVAPDQRILQTSGIGERRIELEEIARQHRDFEDARHRSVDDQRPAHREERLGAEEGRIDPAVVDAAAAAQRARDEVAVGEAFRRRRMTCRGRKHMSVRRVDRDCLHGGHRVRQIGETVVDPLLMRAQGLRVHSCNQLGRAAHDEADQFEILGGFLLLDVERARQPLIGQRRDAPVRRP